MRLPAFLATIGLLIGAAPLFPVSVSAQQQTTTETITCESTSRKRSKCPAAGRIKSARQSAIFAGSLCIQGFSWGYEQGHVWVDFGCSGDFEVESIRAVTETGTGGRETSVETVDCRSRRSNREECEVNGRIQDVEPVGSFTGVPCQYGRSWGYERRHIWVDKGCEARFNVTVTRRGAKPEPEVVVTEPDTTGGEAIIETVDCRPDDNKRKKCQVDGRIQNVEMVGTFTSARCIFGDSWGHKNRHVWVKDGCDARFDVTYTKPSPKPEPEPGTDNSTGSGSGLSAAPLKAIVAQGACTGLYSSRGAGAYIFAVARQCSADAPDCKSVCRDLRRTSSDRKLRQRLKSRSLSCFNSIHVYGNGAAAEGVAGTHTFVYNGCGGSCGPNYCCCSAE